jgi:ABC-type transport system involved in cytochrome c biogenesis permease subunit
MRHVTSVVGSLKLAVAILVVLVGALSSGTIVESRAGADAAARVVYASPWFRALLALFALNVAASLVHLWPWGRTRLGFALTHTSLLVILVGAFMTDQLKREGYLALWEGETSDRVTARPGDPSAVRFTLPFAVRLDAFEIDVYQGTQRPAMFRSRVTVRDPQAGVERAAVIEMNRQLVYGGYSLFQSSYSVGPDRDQTILSVSKDPGQPVVFAGYVLLVVGMLTVLGTRLSARRLARASALAASALVAATVAGDARAASVPDAVTVEALRRLPVQHDGRVMPIDTLAREATRDVTGRRSLWGLDPVALTMGWAFDPRGWMEEPVVAIDSRLAEAAGLPPGTRRASFAALVSNDRLASQMREARAASDGDRPLSALAKQAQRLEGRLIWMQRFLDRSILRVMPASDATSAWTLPAQLESPGDLLGAARSSARALPLAAAEREIRYNRLRPSRFAWWVLTLATGLALAGAITGRKVLDWLAGLALAAGVGAMSWGLVVRWQIAGRIPASNMYESLLFLGWGVGAFALLALVVSPERLVVLNAAAMSALTMALTDLLPIDPFIHPMPPVLSGTPWLAIHVPIIMLSYSVLALGVLVAHVQVAAEALGAGQRPLVARLADTLYWYLHIGSILLAAGIFTGSIWAASSWGRYWGWDPKEVWSLVAFLAYLGILHGRADRLIGSFGVACLSIVAFWTILMTYVGVNFVLSAGLHSYGFGESSVVSWMAAVGVAEVAFLGAASFVVVRRSPEGV